MNFEELTKCDFNKFSYSDNSIAVLGNCIEELKKIQDNTIDLIFADPPYNIGKDFGNNKDKWENTEEYINWCKIWIDECFRVLKNEGTFYFMTATQFMPYLDVYCSEKYNVLSRIVWSYDSSGVQSKKNFGSLYEPILMCNRDKKAKYTFNYKDILVEAKTGAKRKLIDYRKKIPTLYNTQKVPGNVWNFNRVRFKMEEYEYHPTQKPEKLLERIILASSNENDIVLDPFSGTFTTSAVAIKNNRKAIGIELNEEYYKIGIRRTNISDIYNGKTIEKERVKKTNARNKSNFINENQLSILVNEV